MAGPRMGARREAVLMAIRIGNYGTRVTSRRGTLLRSGAGSARAGTSTPACPTTVTPSSLAA
jgi:hypothetical protein